MHFSVQMDGFVPFPNLIGEVFTAKPERGEYNCIDLKQTICSTKAKMKENSMYNSTLSLPQHFTKE